MYYYNRIGLGSKIFPFATPQNAVRKLFYFGVGSKKFSRHNEKNLECTFSGNTRHNRSISGSCFLNSSFCKQAEAIDKNLPSIHLPEKDFPKEKIEKIRSHIHLRQKLSDKKITFAPE
ncbi:hypothetical protein [Porphyromonas gingivalis]|uniref:hypothetical protein n=1 Tax=Porphyromonas gingivalis TaxID=837 RepID=UPI001F1B95D5|nr:hypothetical protein [Porphyromonas gingivalis]